MVDADNNPCRRCGACCLPGVFSLMRDDDITRWREEGRDDILRIIEQAMPFWAGDHIIYSGGGEAERGCVFLETIDGLSSCSIYETRPQVCRNFYPGSSLICPLSGGDKK